MENFVYYLKFVGKKIIFFCERLIKKEYIEFHQFPFNTLAVRLKDEDAKLLYDLSIMLEKMGLIFRVTDGIALGFYRDGHFIRHDNDLDYEIKNIDYAHLKILKRQMKDRGYKVGREVYYKGDIQQITFFDSAHNIADFVIWYQEGSDVVTYCERGYIRIQDVKYFNHLTEFECYGYKFKLPGYIEEWLRIRYGEDWNVPKTYKGDWKDECPDLRTL